MSVTEHAKVDQWVETEQDSLLDALYWRQGFDTRTMELSVRMPYIHHQDRKNITNTCYQAVALTCRCQTPTNPDEVMVGCTNDACNTWLHKDCLVDDILMKTWERKGLENSTVVKEEEGANGYVKIEQSATPEKFSNGTKRETSSARSTPRRGASSTPVPPASLGRAGSVRGKGKKASALKPYTGKYEATLRTDDGPPRFEMQDLRDGVPEAQRQWTESVHCLLCHHVLE